MKAQSICRLELMGALIAARLAETLIAEMMTKIEKVVFWCDIHYSVTLDPPDEF